MKDLTDSEKKRLAEEAVREFPEDEVMRQVHYVRLLHFHLTQGLSRDEQVHFFNSAGRMPDAESGGSYGR